MAGFDNTGTDARQITQAPSSSGGSGGIFGNASAAIGDIGIGSSSAEMGDTIFDTNRNFNFSGPTVTNRKNDNALLIAGVLLLGYIAAKKLKVI